ncbi:ImmA/IrrE family metallo-endopeptidase [Kribbella koreensis]|uniref:ImmA/IrrE family metallo-endopeptidase n=1 Tax=Kribbella koreensis TaxID=57909 RepID=A0ABN1R1F2_9ACTN
MTNSPNSVSSNPNEHPHALRPDWAVHPGAILARYLEANNIRQSELAVRTGLTTKHVNQIVKQAVTISPDVAVVLETALGTPPRFWARAGADWDIYVSEKRSAVSLKEATTWASSFDTQTLIRHGIVTTNDSAMDRARKILGLFGVASPEAFDATWMHPRVSFKRSQAYTVNSQNTALWLRLVERCAEQIRPDTEYKPAKLRRAAAKIPAFTTMPFTTGFEAAQAALADAGVALVFVRQVPETRVCAATWWVGETPVVGVTERHRKPDIFWFSVLHEIGHLLLHPKRTTYLDLEDGADDNAETEANEYAGKVLFPRAAKMQIAAAKSRQELIFLAAEYNLGVAIVAGQHGHLTNDWRTGGSLRQSFSDGDIEKLEKLCRAS